MQPARAAHTPLMQFVLRHISVRVQAAPSGTIGMQIVAA